MWKILTSPKRPTNPKCPNQIIDPSQKNRQPIGGHGSKAPSLRSKKNSMKFLIGSGFFSQRKMQGKRLLKEAGSSPSNSNARRHRVEGYYPLLPIPPGVTKSLGACNSEPRGNFGVSDCETGHKGGMGIFSMVKGAFYGICRLAPREILKNSEKAFRSLWKKVVKKSLTKFSENLRKSFFMKRMSGKNISTRSQLESVEAVGLAGISYSPRGRRWRFSFSIQK